MNNSRYIKYDKRRLPREKRTIRIFGAVSYIDGRPAKDQSNKLFRCWDCGFICNTDRDELGDGVGYVVKDVPDLPDVFNMGASSYEFPQGNASWDYNISLETMATSHLMQIDSEGSAVTVMHNFSAQVNSGCPFCGSKNYK